MPTVAESGYKDYEMDEWNGVLAPARTPKSVVSQLADRFTAALQAPEVKRKLVAQGLYPGTSCLVSLSGDRRGALLVLILLLALTIFGYFKSTIEPTIRGRCAVPAWQRFPPDQCVQSPL